MATTKTNKAARRQKLARARYLLADEPHKSAELYMELGMADAAKAAMDKLSRDSDWV